MFRLTNIAYAYPGGGPALRDASAAVPTGITVVAGPNAGGKTTLLRLLAGLIAPASGSIADGDGRAVAPAELRQTTRMVMQDADPQIIGATVAEDIALGRAASALGAGFDAEAKRLAARLGLDAVRYHRVDELSYGQKRKLCILHALLAGPRCLLLDEPFAGLDFPASRELRDLIRENRDAGLTQVISTHELDPVFDLADRLVVVAGGTVVAEGAPGDLADKLAAWSVRAPGKDWD